MSPTELLPLASQLYNKFIVDTSPLEKEDNFGPVRVSWQAEEGEVIPLPCKTQHLEVRPACVQNTVPTS
jgi:hypothetical protein